MVFVSVNDILNDLKVMFPQYDDELLLTSIRHFNGNIDNIVTYLISLNEGQPLPTRISTANTNEIDMLERQYGIDLHKQWKTRLPGDFLVFKSSSIMDDEQLARQLQNEFDEQASNDLLRSITNDQIYSPPVSNTNHNTSSSSISERTKKWKNRLLNFFNERKGYQRVNTNEDHDGIEMNKV
ncbi:hypothetical protein WA171_004531 [Blastocystis sp. BT1]